MIIKFKIFEQTNKTNPIFKIGDTVYYHGMHEKHHGYYTVTRYYYFTHFDDQPTEKEDTGWRYNIEGWRDRLNGVWEMSLSPTEEEGQRKHKEYHERREDQRKRHIEFDPYGEEVWESKSDVDPYGEEKWDDSTDIVELRKIALDLNLNPTEIEHDNADNADYFEFEINYPKKGKLRFSVSNGSIWWRGDNVMSLISNNSLNIHGPRFTLMDDVIRNVSSDSFVRAYTRIAQLQDNVKNENHDIDPYGEEQWVEDERWINVPDDYLLKRGDKVKIRPDSQFHTERGINGGLYRYEGTILNDRKRKPINAFCWDVRFDNGQTRNYRTEDLMMKIEKDNEMWESYSDIDPYGEEKWGEDIEPQIDFDDDDRERRYYRRAQECRLCGRYYPNALMLDDVCPVCRTEENMGPNYHCISCGRYAPKHSLKDGMCDTCLKEPGWDI